LESEFTIFTIPETELLIEEKFMLPSQSGLTAKVTKNSGKFDFQVERYVARPGHQKTKR
jgi:hypothetical protein